MSAEMLDCPALGCKEEFVGTIARNLHALRSFWWTLGGCIFAAPLVILAIRIFEVLARP